MEISLIPIAIEFSKPILEYSRKGYGVSTFRLTPPPIHMGNSSLVVFPVYRIISLLLYMSGNKSQSQLNEELANINLLITYYNMHHTHIAFILYYFLTVVYLEIQLYVSAPLN